MSRLFAGLLAPALVIVIGGVSPTAVTIALGASGCNRIQVESRDRGALLSSYVVSEPDYVAKIRTLIEVNGQDGTWTVAAGELGTVGYTVTYSCLP